MTIPSDNSDIAINIDKRVVLVVTTFTVSLLSLLSSSLNVAIPSLGNELGTDAVTLTWIPMAALLAGAVFLVPFGKLADIYGRKRFFLLGTCVFTFATLMAGLSNSASTLIVWQTLQGVGNALIFATSLALVVSAYPSQERGWALGISVAAIYIALAIGPTIGGFLTYHWGWRSVFFLGASLGAIMVVLTIWQMRAEWTAGVREPLDVVGSAIFGIALFALMLGFSSLPALTGCLLIPLGITCLGVFFLWEQRVKNPVLEVDLFRHNTTFAFCNLSSLISYASTAALTFLVSINLQVIQGLGADQTGLVLLAMPIVMAILSPFTGRLSDQYQPRVMASAGMALTAVGLAFLALIGEAGSVALIVAALLICGLGFSIFVSPNMNCIMLSVDRTQYGIASATTNVMRLVGQMLSMGIASLTIAVFVGDVQITPLYHTAFLNASRVAFIIFALLCGAGAIASLMRGKAQPGAADGPPIG